MSLPLLPVEILVQIIKESIPEGFEGLALTCKRVYDASVIFREQHNKLRRRYRNFKYDIKRTASDDHENNCFSSLHLLLKIADNPLIARYIVSANLRDDPAYTERDSDEEIDSSFEGFGPSLSTIRGCSNFRSLFETSPYLRSAGIDPTFFCNFFVSQDWQDRRPVYLYSGIAGRFLLTLLPNVVDLTLPRDWETFRMYSFHKIHGQTYSLLDEIIQRVNDLSHSSVALSRLVSVSADPRYFSWEWSAIYPILSIKGVKAFRSSGEYCGRFPDHSHHDFAPTPWDERYRVDLEVVEFASTCVTEGGLQAFLSRLSQLRTLKLSTGSKWHLCWSNMNAQNFIKVIEDTVGPTLENLSFSVHYTFRNIEAGITSMKGLSKLKNLELDIQLLFGDGSYSKVPQLGDLLPPSLEGLCLMVRNLSNSAADLAYFFPGSCGEKDDAMPNLKQIVVRYSCEGPPDRDPFELSWPPLSTRLKVKRGIRKLLTKRVNISQLKAQLKALGPSVSIKFVKVDDKLGASFMEGFGEKPGRLVVF